MKSIHLIAGLVVSSMLCWGASTDEFKFVSTLSAPVASFDTVETKSCVVTEPEGILNVGTAASTGGTINVQGGPVQINKLYMEDGTKIGSADIKWLVTTLNIGKNATVRVKNLLASAVALWNSDSVESKLDVTNTLQIGSQIYATNATAKQILNVYQCSDEAYDADKPCFQFDNSKSSAGATGTAGWGKVNAQTYNSGDTETLTSENDATKYYPISTEF